MFASGRMTVVSPWEDDETHIDEHNRYRKTMDYWLLDDEQRAAIDTHIKAHETQAAEKLGRRSAGSQVSPLMAAAPMADGSPIIDPSQAMPPPQPVAEPNPELAALDAVGSNTDAIIQAMMAEGGGAAPPEAAPPIP